MSAKSHSLNLYDLETSAVKFEVDCTTAAVTATSSGSQVLTLDMPVQLIDAVGGNISNLSTKIHATDTNVSSYISSNNSSVATISSTVTANKAISDSNHASDSAARTTLQTTLQGNLDAEETSRENADTALTSALSTEISDRVAAELVLTNALNVEKLRIDGIVTGSSIDLNSFLELVNAYTNLNTSALAEIASLQTQITSAQAQIDELTSP